MYCNNCGTNNPHTSVFCQTCGNKLTQSLASTNMNNNVQPFQPMNTNMNSNVQPAQPMNTNMNSNVQPAQPMNTNMNSNVQPAQPMNTNMNSNVQPVQPMNTNMNSNVQPAQPMNTNMNSNVQPVQPMNINMNSNMQVNQTNNKPKKGKKGFIIGGIVLTTIVVIVTLVFLGSKIITGSVNNKRTIMIYMIGSDLESKNGMATLDIKEIEKSGVDLTQNNVVVYAGGAKTWKNNFENNSVYNLTEKGFELVKQDEESSMGEASTLTGFLNYVKGNYESSSYSLILWDHGAGPIIGYGMDEVHESDTLFIFELEKALRNSDFSNEKLEFIGFDACLMSSVEVASILSSYTNYMIASQDLEPGYGWDYNFLSEVNKDVDTEGLGKLIIDYMDKYYKDLSQYLNNSSEFFTTLSLIDLTKMKTLENNLNNLFQDVDITLSNNGYSRIVSQMTKATKFGYAGYNQSYDLIDLGGVVEELKVEYDEKATELQKSIDEAIVYQKTNVEGANGISIYYPYYTKEYLDKFLEVYETLHFAEDYTEFLKNYSKILTGQRLYDYNLTNKALVFSSDNESITIDLNESEVNNYNKTDYVIFRDMKDGYYMPVYKSSDVTLKNNKLIANFNKKQLSVNDAEGESGWATMFEYERAKSYVIYNVPAVLVKTKDGWDSESVNIQLKVDSKNPNGVIIGVTSTIDVDDASTMKKVINLEDWDYIQFFNSKYDFYDDNGVYLENWKSSGTVYLTEVSLEKGYEIEFIDLEKEYDYYCMFQIYDTQGNVHYTNLIKVDKK